MKRLVCFLWVCLTAGTVCAGARGQENNNVPATEKITNPAVPKPVQSPGIVGEMLAKSPHPGYMEPAQVKAVLDQIRFTEYRINDLMEDLHPDRWKMSEAARNSFSQTIATLRSQMKVLKGWREDFAARPDSMAAGFETYATIGAILPRLDGVAKTITHADNPSFGAQFDQPAGKLFDLQQKLAPYIGFLLQNQDSIVQALESNMAACQTELGHALKGKAPRPKWMRNSAPVRARRTRVKPRTKSKKETGSPKNPSKQ